MPQLLLYSPKTREVQPKGGLNWGFANAHVNPDDAYIALPISFFRKHPRFFPSHGNVIDVTWDDGRTMKCRLEGTQYIDGILHPKQLSSNGDKSVIGTYLRRRLGVPSSYLVTMTDLARYGRDHIDVSYISGSRYFFDFS